MAKKRISVLKRKLSAKEGAVRKLERFSRKSRGELERDAKREKKRAVKSVSRARVDRARAKRVKGQVLFDVKVHRLEKGDVKEALHEVDELSCAVDDTQYIIDEAKKVQTQKK